MGPTGMAFGDAARELCALPGDSHHPNGIRLTIRIRTSHPHQLGIGTLDSPESATMVIVGELDTSAARVVADRCIGYITSVGSVAIDLSEVTLIDSAGIRLLEQLRDIGRTRSGRVWLVEPSPVVQRVLEATGMQADTSPRHPYQQAVQPTVDPDNSSPHRVWTC